MSGRLLRVRGLLLFRAPLIAVAVLSAAQSAWPAEVVTLRSGFTVTCTARESVTPDTERLYLSAEGKAGTNFMDVPLASVLRVETAPDTEQLTVAGHQGIPPSSLPLRAILQSSGAAHNVNVMLLASVVRAESGGNAHAISRTGARGLMQLMPATAAQLRVRDSLAPDDNVNGGSAYLDHLLTHYHENIALALAAYNAGPGAVDRFHGIPPYRETRLYVAKVLREFNRLVLSERSIAASATVLSQGAGR